MLGHWTAWVPMLPEAPLTSTRCPGRTPALSRRKNNAVVAPSAAAAASAKVSLSGFRHNEPSAGRRTYSAWPPTEKPVNPKTRSPGAEPRHTGTGFSTTWTTSGGPKLVCTAALVRRR
ncbi:hypothetical protein SAMN05421507_11625 [Lentzea jiangxiensis]|uniref:Uncharacterized protein n=1 Tax=Lentzea jiangxiensis TaxID=641025 RepID=A0A1H0VWC7_9PSEU|nr:hypothetical protein SAMN05421507_11625 [Lentzea jiangxiensis]